MQTMTLHILEEKICDVFGCRRFLAASCTLMAIYWQYIGPYVVAEHKYGPQYRAFRPICVSICPLYVRHILAGLPPPAVEYS